MAKSRRDPDVDDAVPKPKSDAYTGLLVASLLAQMAGALFLFLDWNQYPEKAPKKVMDRPQPAAAAPVDGGAKQPLAAEKEKENK